MEAYKEKVCGYLEQYTKVLVVSAFHVTNNHLSIVRRALEGRGAHLIMGGNVTMKACVVIHSEKAAGNEIYRNLLPHIAGPALGFIFTNDNWRELMAEVSELEVDSPYALSPLAVYENGHVLSGDELQDPVAAAAAGGGGSADEESEDDDMGFGLFGW